MPCLREGRGVGCLLPVGRGEVEISKSPSPPFPASPRKAGFAQAGAEEGKTFGNRRFNDRLRERIQQIKKKDRLWKDSGLLSKRQRGARKSKNLFKD